MVGSSPQEAVHNFIDPLQRVLSCLTDATLDWRGGYRLGAIHPVALNQGEAARLPRSRLALRVSQSYSVVIAEPPQGPYKVSTRAFLYALEDQAGHEILAYHWHPKQTQHFPHLHLGHGAKIGRRELQKAHLPTGRVSLEEFVRFMITDFHVAPARLDWDSVLAQAQAAFEKWRTWP